jgi:hypothetical protein
VKLIPEWDMRQEPCATDIDGVLVTPTYRRVQVEPVGDTRRLEDLLAPVNLDAEELARRLNLRCPECGQKVETRSATTAGLLNVEYTTLHGYGMLVYAECRQHGMVSRSVTREHLKLITERAA